MSASSSPGGVSTIRSPGPARRRVRRSAVPAKDASAATRRPWMLAPENPIWSYSQIVKPSSAASAQAPSMSAHHSSVMNGGSSPTEPHSGPAGASPITTAWWMPPRIICSICQRRRSRVTRSPLHHQIGSGPNRFGGDANRSTSVLAAASDAGAAVVTLRDEDGVFLADRDAHGSGEMRTVLKRAEQGGGRLVVLPEQTQEVQPGHLGHAAAGPWQAVRLEDRQGGPAVSPGGSRPARQ